MAGINSLIAQVNRRKSWMIASAIVLPLATYGVWLALPKPVTAASVVQFRTQAGQPRANINLDRIVARMQHAKNLLELEKAASVESLDPHHIAYRVNPSQQSITITVTDEPARRAEALANAGAKQMADSFNAAQKAHLAKEIARVQEEINALKLHQNHPAMDETQHVPSISTVEKHPAASSLDQLHQLYVRQEREKARVAALQGRVKKLLPLLNPPPAKVPLEATNATTQEIEKLKKALAEAKVNLTLLQAKYGPQHPRLQQGQYLVSSLELQLLDAMEKQAKKAESKTSSRPGSHIPQIRSELNAIQQELGQHQQAMAAIQNGISALERNLSEVPQMNETVHTEEKQPQAKPEPNEPALKALKDEEAQLKTQLQHPSPYAYISKKASVSQPLPWLWLLGSLLISPFVGLALACLFEKARRNPYNPAKIEDIIHLPILQEIPFDDRLFASMPGHKSDYEDYMPETQLSIALVQDQNSAAVYDALLELKNRLAGYATKTEKVFTVLSPSQGSGTTFLAANLACLFAKDGYRTLLVDANLIQPEIHSAFSLLESPGLMNVLDDSASIKDAIKPVKQFGKLAVLPAGQGYADSLDYLNHPRLHTLIESLKKHFDVIFFNAPSGMDAIDSTIIANLSQKVLLNMRQKDATLPNIRRWQKQLSHVQPEKVGLVINFKQ